MMAENPMHRSRHNDDAAVIAGPPGGMLAVDGEGAGSR